MADYPFVVASRRPSDFHTLPPFPARGLKVFYPNSTETATPLQHDKSSMLVYNTER